MSSTAGPRGGGSGSKPPDAVSLVDAVRLDDDAESVSRRRVALCLAAWFASSLGALVLNKVVLSTLNVAPERLGAAQLLGTTLLGALSTRPDPGPAESRLSLRLTVGLLALLRYSTVVLTLVALQHVAASFVETIKATAPLWTVWLQFLVLREATTGRELAALTPMVAGLALCAWTEQSFNATGFAAAVACNAVDCLQNVLTKKVLQLDVYSPARLQFMTSLCASVLQLPILLYHELRPQGALIKARAGAFHALVTAFEALASLPAAGRGDAYSYFLRHRKAICVFADVLCCHVQSVSAFYAVSLLSPVSASVANALKRALLIILSIVYFGNPVTPYSFIGIVVVIFGAALYKRAQHATKNKHQTS
ncbi:triose-phosphate transporter family-domain-containing protein [Pelagophyceae sp. CCMP2097]|nr:triose-phosphate transporter family-domain-containing protein [Pelagophyceae sp. CCMP2097]